LPPVTAALRSEDLLDSVHEELNAVVLFASDIVHGSSPTQRKALSLASLTVRESIADSVRCSAAVEHPCPVMCCNSDIGSDSLSRAIVSMDNAIDRFDLLAACIERTVASIPPCSVGLWRAVELINNANPRPYHVQYDEADDDGEPSAIRLIEDDDHEDIAKRSLQPCGDDELDDAICPADEGDDSDRDNEGGNKSRVVLEFVFESLLDYIMEWTPAAELLRLAQEHGFQNHKKQTALKTWIEIGAVMWDAGRNTYTIDQRFRQAACGEEEGSVAWCTVMWLCAMGLVSVLLGLVS